jgi:hypothetical protein
MNLVVVFHPPQPGGHIQASKLVSPEKDPPNGGGGELVQAFTGKYVAEHQIIHLELPTIHKPLVIALERLAVHTFWRATCHLLSLTRSTSSRQSWSYVASLYA